jgi:tetratricopeptide (TPR) repeat protein
VATACLGGQCRRPAARRGTHRLGRKLDFLAKFVSPPAAPATAPRSNAPPRAAARELFIEAERIRLRPASEVAPAVDTPSATHREHLARAISLYQSALERDPTHYWARFQLARCQLALGRTAEAVEALSACVALRPHVPWAYTARGLALALVRRFEEGVIASPAGVATYTTTGIGAAGSVTLSPTP